MIGTLSLLHIVCAAPAASMETTDVDWFSKVYTAEGVEIRTDDRVFALFSAFNAAGLDAGPATRRDPVPKFAYHPVRQMVRAKVSKVEEKQRLAFDGFLDAHQLPIERYLGYVLSAGIGAEATGKDWADLKGLGALIGEVHRSWGAGTLYESAHPDQRSALRTYLSAVDKPIARARALLRNSDKRPIVLIVNLLDVQDAVRTAATADAVYIVVGPAGQPNVEGVLRGIAQLYVHGAAQKKVREWGGGAALLREAQAAGALETTVLDYGEALLTRALAMRAVDAADSAYDAASQSGYYGVRDLGRMFDDPRSPEAWVLDAWAKAETRRPGKR